MKYLLACLLFFVLVFSTFENVSAQEKVQFKDVTGGMVNEALMNTVPIRFLPSNPLYFFIWIKEGFSRFFQPSAARRAEFDSVLAGKRLKESYLLLKNGDIQNSSAALSRYSGKVKSMISQFNKARSQNQDIAEIIDESVFNFSQEEILLSAISEESKNNLGLNNFGVNFNFASEEFARGIYYLNSLKPGVANRFTSLKGNEEGTPSASSSSAIQAPSGEPTPSAKPLRIIY